MFRKRISAIIWHCIALSIIFWQPDLNFSRASRFSWGVTDDGIPDQARAGTAGWQEDEGQRMSARQLRSSCPSFAARSAASRPAGRERPSAQTRSSRLAAHQIGVHQQSRQPDLSPTLCWRVSSPRQSRSMGTSVPNASVSAAIAPLSDALCRS